MLQMFAAGHRDPPQPLANTSTIRRLGDLNGVGWLTYHLVLGAVRREVTRRL